MKHTWKITWILVALFVLAQLIGLGFLSKSMHVEMVSNGTAEMVNLTYAETVAGTPQRVDDSKQSFWFMIIAFAIGTALILLIVKLKKLEWWKILFFIVVWMTMSIAFSLFVQGVIAFVLSFIFTAWRIYKPNVWIHNFVELFIYSGMVLLIVPLFDVEWIIILLLVISVYDIIAVWKSKHMVKMAKFMTDKSNNLFAGLVIPYDGKQAILGGGDIAFPLIFTGVVMEHLIRVNMIPKLQAFLFASIIIVTAAMSLFALFYYAEKDKFYPAMPFLTGGCLVGGLIVWLTQIL